MLRGSALFGLKRRIYAVATTSVLALVLLSVVFTMMLDRQHRPPNGIEARHPAGSAALSGRFSRLSANHLEVVDHLTSSPKQPDVAIVGELTARLIRDLGRLEEELGKIEDIVPSSAPSSAPTGIIRDRLIRGISTYRKSIVAAISVSPTSVESAMMQLRAANRDYRRLADDFGALVRQTHEAAPGSLVVPMDGSDTPGYAFGLAAALIIGLLGSLVFLLLRTVTRDVAGITNAMGAVAGGRRDVDIPGLERRDEIGEMARALAIFKTNFEKLDDLANLEERSRQLEDKVRALHQAKQAYEAKLDRLNSSARNLAQARDEAEASDKAKSTLLAAISYEIRTPMNGLMGMAGLLLDGPLTEEQREYATSMRDSGGELLEVVNNLLDFTRLEAGDLELDVGEFDLVALIESIPDLIMEDCGQEASNLAFNLSPDVPRTVIGDSERFSQTLINLLLTAMKSGEHSGIEIDVSMADPDEVRAIVRTTVVVHQAPVTARNAASWIDRAWREPGTHATDAPSKGLAMAISDRIARLMGGEIGHERTGDGQYRYWFTARLGIAAGGAAQENTGWLNGKRVLVADCPGSTQDALGRQFESWGMSVYRAPDGRAALARMARAYSQNQQFDLVIVAATLPDMEGIGFVRAMRSSEGTGGVKLVMTCAAGNGPTDDQVDKLGIASIIEQPVTPLRLLAAVTGALEGARWTASRPNEAKERGDGDSRDDRVSEKLRVLLADDNQVNRRVVTEMLKRTGHTVDTVINGVEAVRAVRSVPYDIVLMDIQMPEMDGTEATREIRCLPGDVANVPIVALTANAMDGDREKYLAAGMDDYISKPIDKQRLIDIIHRLGTSRSAFAKDAAPAESTVDRISDPSSATPPSNVRAGS